MAGFSHLPVHAFLLESAQGPLFGLLLQRLIGRPLGVLICLPDPAHVVWRVPLRDMGNLCETFQKVLHNSSCRLSQLRDDAVSVGMSRQGRRVSMSDAWALTTCRLIDGPPSWC